MITLYRKITEIIKKSKWVGTTSVDPSTGRTIYSGKYEYEEVEQINLKTVLFPNDIFTYYGWYADYREKCLYRWKGTDKEQIFMLDDSLLNAANENIIPPEDWLKITGNKIILEYYDKCKYIPYYKAKEGNPSGNKGNVWLMSYRRGDDTEVYLYEYMYNEDDDMVSQVALSPRNQTDQPPRDTNSQNNTQVDDTPTEPDTPDPTPDNPVYDDSNGENTTETPNEGYNEGENNNGSESEEENHTESDETENTDTVDDDENNESNGG
ncbi:MAG: hypothetical protein K5685_06525 [Bacteroidales bacterium]|nr:hypothetical protein [Bacteroidales bacterium]